MSLYTTLPWATLCEEVSKLNLDLRAGQLVALRKAANSGVDSGGSGNGLLQPLLQPHRVTEKASMVLELKASLESAQGGTRTRFEAKKTLSRKRRSPPSP